MKTLSYADMKGGWFVGAFQPTAFHTGACEVSYKIHRTGEAWPTHYHCDATEINLLTQGRMTIQGRELVEGTIFVLEPYEVANPVFHADCHVVCVKVPGVRDDKVVIP